MSTSYAKPLPAVSPFEHARAHAEQVERELAAETLMRAPHDEVEAYIEAEGREWSRRMLEGQLALRAQQEQRTEVAGADGEVRSRVRASRRKLETVLGTVEVPRLAYQQPGYEDLHPMDAALNLPQELFSYGVRRLVAKQAAHASFDEVVEQVASPKRSAFSRA